MVRIIDIEKESGKVESIKHLIDLDFIMKYDSGVPAPQDAAEDNDGEDELTIVKLTDPQSRFLMLEEKYPLFVAGFGAGKSTTLIANVLKDLEISNKVKIGCYCPTYDLLRLITAPYLEERLLQAGIAYKYNKSEQIIYIETGQQIILRSMDNPARIVGYQTFRAHIDELDTLLESKAEEAWNKIIARNRQKIPKKNDDGKYQKYDEDQYNDKDELIAVKGSYVCHTNRVSAYTTPEGFRFCYKRWVKEKTNGYVYVQASTLSNPHNPPDYVDSLRNTYPPGLIDAYIEGKFVNLTSGSVYPEFSRELNNTNEEIKFGEQLHVGMDFNVGNMSAKIFVIRDDEPYLLDEIDQGRDTETVCEILRERYGGKHAITVYPDAAGQSTSSKSASISDLTIIKRFGFVVKAKSVNPFIKDRVISVNGMILNANGKRSFWVNTKKCPNATDALEQQTWDNGMPDKKSGHDHSNDAVGYFIHWHWPVRKIVRKSGRVETHVGR